MELRIAHSLAPQEVARRIAAAAVQHEVELSPADDGLRGALVKDAGFLGKVRAEYSIEPDALVVRVTERPTFLPESSLRRMLEAELGKLIAV